MVIRAMWGRWTTYTIQYSCFLLLILVLVQGCSSLNLEGLALLDFRAGVSHDPLGALASWNPDDDDPCSWCNVHCVYGNVQALDLNGLSLEGVLAPELGKLTHLRCLVLSQNHFSGAIPKELGELKMLEVLDLRDNNLVGNVPPEIGRMQSLKRLLLCNNNLEGTIPTELESLCLLYELQSDENLTFRVTDIIGFMNRKLGHCIWQDGFKHLKNADSLLFPFKETVINYLNPFQLFGKGISHNSCVNEESAFEPGMVQNVHIDGNVIRRRLAEQSVNLVAAPSSSDVSVPDYIIALPSSRSSGSFPAVPKENTQHLVSPTPSPVKGPGQETPTPTSSGQSSESKTNSDKWKIIIGMSCAAFLLITAIALLFICRSRAVKTMGPWRSGLSGQLQKAFVTGVPKLDQTELETACEDFSNIVETMEGCTLYKGTLSSGVEICVASTTITSFKDWSKRAELGFLKKIDMLSRVNHKNFVNLIGYCVEDEPFVRVMVFEYAPNGSLSEHLHVKELEHLDWSSRMRIIMGVAYCLQCMHDLNPPVVHTHLNSKMIHLTEDYAAKVADLSFWRDFLPKAKISGENVSVHSQLPPLADTETNVYSFGVLLLEIITGRHPYSDKQESLVTWAERYLNDKQNISHMIDPTLKSFKHNELEVVCEVIEECIQKDARQRPTINEIITKLRGVLGISLEQATPRLSPLWWAELEILSAEAA